MPISTWELVIGLIVTTVGAAVQGTIGFGLGVLSVPILAMVNPIMVPVPQLLVVLPLTIAMFYQERHHIIWSSTAWTLSGRIPGAILGILTVKAVSGAAQSALDAVIALAVLAAVGLLSLNVNVERTRATEFAAGTTSGFMGLVAGIGGPPLALLYRNETGPTIRATLSAVITVGLAITLTTRGVTGEISTSDLQIAALLLPGQLLGFLASFRLRHHVSGTRLRRAILIVSAVSATMLLARAAL